MSIQGTVIMKRIFVVNVKLTSCDIKMPIENMTMEEIGQEDG